MNIPIATYRIQLTKDFGFKSVRETAGYLERLGISHVYASPILKAKKDSLHGYDWVDPDTLNPQLGSAGEFDILIADLQRRKMGWIQDIVPNHMAYDSENRLLADVFENGSDSEFYKYFDVDWNHRSDCLKGKLQAPFLGRRYAECLVDGEIKLAFDNDGFAAVYYDLKLPLRLSESPDLLRFKMSDLRNRLGIENKKYQKYASLVGQLEKLSRMRAAERDASRIRATKDELFEMYRNNPDITRAVDETLATYNGTPGEPDSFVLLDSLLSKQFFQLCFWKTATQETNYRRFFDINGLITLQQNRPTIFDRTHRVVLGLVEAGHVSGLRVDHVDGLSDPSGYLDRLRDKAGDIYLVVEKILGRQEPLPENWPVQGTTGYEFSDWVNALFVNPESETEFTAIYSDFVEDESSFQDVSYSARRRVLYEQFAGDLENLVHRFKQIASRTRGGCDITTKRLERALAEILCRFPVYRTYIDSGRIRESDRKYIRAAAEMAVLQFPDLLDELSSVKQILLMDIPYAHAGEQHMKSMRKKAVEKFQQLTASLTAKGLEDTALYTYNRLLSLNDVGYDPDGFGCRVERFHDFMKQRARLQPHAMNATQTHDSKRGEDVRARLNVLSEIPVIWKRHLYHWHDLNRDKKVVSADRLIPDKNEEYFIYQTLVGTWPFDKRTEPSYMQRLEQYLVKALREAKVHSSWLTPETDYEADVMTFIDRILTPSGENAFWKSFLPFCSKISKFGIVNTLSQVLTKITAPGIPDFYRGSEIMDLSFVDPDNRRPVDYEACNDLIEKARGGDPTFSPDRLMLDRFGDRIKLFVITKALEFRNREAVLFKKGAYVPIGVSGHFKSHAAAFARRLDNRWCITVVPRFLAALGWDEETCFTEEFLANVSLALPSKAPSHWMNVFTGESVDTGGDLVLGSMLGRFPVVLLAGK